MITITNSKLSRLKPGWADFRGFTLLFDNPGASLLQDGAIEYVNVESDLPLYGALNSALQKIGHKELANNYHFFALSPRSYHVTACDGGNVDNCAHVNDSCRDALTHLLKGLPYSLCQKNEFAEMINSTELVVNTKWSIQLEFDYLANWSGVSMVAGLKPADSESMNNLAHFTEARQTLCTDLNQLFGINPPESFVPHITLGYFANPDCGKQTETHMGEWQDLFRHEMEGVSICFNSTSLYGFTDMETFFRCKQGATTVSPSTNESADGERKQCDKK